MNVITRFAPSPTGYLHVGGVRTALFAWLVARQNKGKFILRLEDTDKKREVTGADQHIVDSLTTLGLIPDEGPIRQSERLENYKKWAQKLIDSGRAYADPYTSEEVQGFRDQARLEKKPFLYRNHRPSLKLPPTPRLWRTGRPTSRPENPPTWDGSQPLRFKSEPKAYTWHDEVMGDIATGPEVIDDFILIKSDGYPTYNFAHIIDDAEMAISHVIRGQEFLASVPNYLNLYEALGLEPPIMATMPHILGPDGKKKLSKRDGAKDVLDYVREGFLPEALISFIATLGWNDGTEQEVFTVDELIKKFSLDRVQRSGARFDEQRLLWVNGHFIRSLDISDTPDLREIARSQGKLARVESGLTEGEVAIATSREDRPLSAEISWPGDGGVSGKSGLYARCQDYWPQEARDATEAYKKQVLALVQERLKYLAELPELTRFFFTDLPVNKTLIDTNKHLQSCERSDLARWLGRVRDELERSDFSVSDLTDRLNKLLETTGQKPAVLFSLVRIATTQAPASPGLAETLAVLGKETSLRRIDQLLHVYFSKL